MGVRNYLIEGMSGAGKTTVAEELERRNCHVIHGDRELAYHGDPDTGEPLEGPIDAEGLDGLRWRHRRWIWNVDKVRSLVADKAHAATFFCGGSRNHPRFADLFDKVFVLDVDPDTLKRRVLGRTDGEFGSKPADWAMLVSLGETKEDVPKEAVRIDGARPVARVVDEILRHCARRNP